MKTTFSRRRAIQAAGAAAAAPGIHLAAQPRQRSWPFAEGPGTPKLCLEIGWNSFTDRDLRRIRQLGITHLLSGWGRIPWDEAELRAKMDRIRAAGMTLYNMMISGFPNTIYGRPGRDEEIEKVIQSIRAAGRAGLPVVEYNFYAYRLVEGYYEETGRGGAGLTAYTYDKVKDLPPKPEIGTHSLDEMWKNITYFLKAVIPEAEKAGVRMALHPNDPPVPLSRGSSQIMATLEGWKKLVSIVPSPSNGITYDCGVTKEIGEDPVEVFRYFMQRKAINHMHYRNVRVRKPYVDYTEVFPDEGEVDMFAVMKEVVRLGYNGIIYPEHPRALDIDRERPDFKPYYPGGGSYAGSAYNVAYTRAMLQAAMASV